MNPWHIAAIYAKTFSLSFQVSSDIPHYIKHSWFHSPRKTHPTLFPSIPMFSRITQISKQALVSLLVRFPHHKIIHKFFQWCTSSTNPWLVPRQPILISIKVKTIVKCSSKTVSLKINTNNSSSYSMEIWMVSKRLSSSSYWMKCHHFQAVASTRDTTNSLIITITINNSNDYFSQFLRKRSWQIETRDLRLPKN